MNNSLFFLGSLPYESVTDAIDFVKKYSSHLPFLPQLPEANPQEDMVGQVLRGIELGYWDESASSCLELFQNEFVDAKRIKVQLAGPMTVARSLCTDTKEITPSWLNFWKGLVKQLTQAGFKQEIWLQIDEPFWSKDVKLPADYLYFLGEIKKSRPLLKLGLHSCNKQRPEMDEVLVPFTDFFSFNYIDSPMKAEDLATWTQLLSITDLNLVMGVIPKGTPFKGVRPRFDEKYNNRIWTSPPCGLYDWTAQEIETTFIITAKDTPLAGTVPSRIERLNAEKA